MRLDSAWELLDKSDDCSEELSDCFDVLVLTELQLLKRATSIKSTVYCIIIYLTVGCVAII